jgi:serine protease Do
MARMFRGGLIWVIGTLLLYSSAGFALEANEVFKRADPSIVVVATSDKDGKERFGSGVIIAAREVITNCHVIKDASAINVKQGNVQRVARLHFQDTARDLCQVQLDDTFPAGKPISGVVLSVNLEVGQQVFAIGSPRGLERTLSRGIVSALRGVKDGAKLIQTDAAVTHGSSGGGLFDSEARLVGIITFGVEEGNLNFAVPADWIQDITRRNPDKLVDVPGRSQGGARVPADKENDGFLRPGDRWKYRVLLGKQRVGATTVEIIEANGKLAHERITYDGSKGFVRERSVEATFNPARFQTPVMLPGGYQLAELSPYADPATQFTIGQRWSDVTGAFAPQGGSMQSVNSTVAVVATETVNVPAGAFKAWRIESTSEDLYAVGQFFLAKCTYWYAPEMKRTVKMILYYKARLDAISSVETYELESFEQGK